MLFKGTRSGGREDCLSTVRTRGQGERSQETRIRERIERAEFRSAEKSVERTALKTRTGARPMEADPSLRLLIVTTLFVIEPTSS